jgi:hypothetical protein
VLQAEEFTEPLGLRHAAAALRAVVDFLQPDDVRLQRVEHAGRALEIHDVVVSAPVPDVVRDDAQALGWLRGWPRGRDDERGEGQREKDARRAARQAVFQHGGIIRRAARCVIAPARRPASGRPPARNR